MFYSALLQLVLDNSQQAIVSNVKKFPKRKKKKKLFNVSLEYIPISFVFRLQFIFKSCISSNIK